jgi:hypothetical protein
MDCRYNEMKTKSVVSSLMQTRKERIKQVNVKIEKKTSNEVSEQ